MNQKGDINTVESRICCCGNIIDASDFDDEKNNEERDCGVGSSDVHCALCLPGRRSPNLPPEAGFDLTCHRK